VIAGLVERAASGIGERAARSAALAVALGAVALAGGAALGRAQAAFGALAAAWLFALTDAIDAVAQAAGSEPNAVFFPPLIARLLIPIAFLVGLARETIGRGSVGSLVVELDAAGSETIEDALRRTLHDPSLRLGYKLPGADGYVSPSGEPVDLPGGESSQAATLVERGGEPLETLAAGDFFGEAAILTGERRNATVTAGSDVTVLVLFGTEFRVLESELPAAAEKIRLKMMERAARGERP